NRLPRKPALAPAKARLPVPSDADGLVEQQPVRALPDPKCGIEWRGHVNGEGGQHFIDRDPHFTEVAAKCDGVLSAKVRGVIDDLDLLDRGRMVLAILNYRGQRQGWPFQPVHLEEIELESAPASEAAVDPAVIAEVGHVPCSAAVVPARERIANHDFEVVQSQ